MQSSLSNGPLLVVIYSSLVAFESGGTKEDSMQHTINEGYSRRDFFNFVLSSRCIEHYTTSGCHSDHGK
jgi:hypothetical protein